MTTFLLIRHAATDVIGKIIAGRTPGVHLNDRGREQAERLGAYLSQTAIRAVYSGPLERCRETAEPIARRFQLPVIVFEPLNEVEYGAWTGRSLEALEPLAEWRRFNALRSVESVPGGELILEIQVRIVRLLEMLRKRHSGETVALVTHAEVIRAAQAHYLGIPIDLAYRLEISPASISTICSDENNICILGVNQQPLNSLQTAT